MRNQPSFLVAGFSLPELRAAAARKRRRDHPDLSRAHGAHEARMILEPDDATPARSRVHARTSRADGLYYGTVNAAVNDAVRLMMLRVELSLKNYLRLLIIQ